MLEFSLYRDCFSSAGMRAIWSEQATIAAWLKVEQVLAHSQAELGLIPKAAAAALAGIRASDLDQAQLQDDMMLAGRPIVGLVRQLRAQLGDHGPHVHFRTTTQDIMDTATALQMKQGLAHVQEGVGRIIGALDRHISESGGTLIMGRTNGQHALPMQLSTKLQVWQAELQRRSDSLSDAAGRGLNVQIGGPVGDLQAYGADQGLKVKQRVASSLGLHSADPHWQNSRDGLAEIISALGALCACLCKISHNVNLLSSSDIGEVRECHSIGKGASSSMGHKRNQRASEFGEAVARLGRQRAEQIGELTLQQHERSGGAWIGEWLVVPETFLLTSGAVAWAERMFGDMVVNRDAMAATLSNAQHA